MGLSPRTLKFAVDIGRKAYDRLTDTDLDAQIETAAMAAGERAAEDDADLDPTGVRDLIAVTLQDSTELAEGVDELVEQVAEETE